MAPFEQKPFLSVAAGIAHKDTGPDIVEQATHRFVKMLFAQQPRRYRSRDEEIRGDRPARLGTSCARHTS